MALKTLFYDLFSINVIKFGRPDMTPKLYFARAWSTQLCMLSKHINQGHQTFMSPLWRITREPIHLPLRLVGARKGHAQGANARKKSKKNPFISLLYLWKDSDDKRKAGRRTDERHIYRPQQRDALKCDIMRWPAAECPALRGSTPSCAIWGGGDGGGGSSRKKEAPASPWHWATLRWNGRLALVTRNGSMVRPKQAAANDTGHSDGFHRPGRCCMGKKSRWEKLSEEGKQRGESTAEVRWTFFELFVWL